MELLHTPAHTVEVPDIYTTPDGRGYSAEQDLYAMDPRDWTLPHEASVHVFAPRRSAEPYPGHCDILAVFQDEWDESGDADKALAAARAYSLTEYPYDTIRVGTETIRGYSQGDWADVVAVAEDGFGYPSSVIDAFRMYYYGDVWRVTRLADGESIGGIYTDDGEDAVRHAIEFF